MPELTFFMKPSVVIMNFTKVYEYETFYRDTSFIWLDCRDIPGTYCYCDSGAQKTIQFRMAGLPLSGIHFLDSGSYHYISKFWTDKIREPFSLVLIDHHTDMLPPAFGDILSCGSWVKEVLDGNSNVKKVILIGVSDLFISRISPDYLPRVVIPDSLQTLANLTTTEPVYISIDKDVLNPQTVSINWDQGNMSLRELAAYLSVIKQKNRIIGVDICGESDHSLLSLRDMKAVKRNNRVNRELINLLSD